MEEESDKAVWTMPKQADTRLLVANTAKTDV